MKEKSKEDAKKNVDPLTGAPGSAADFRREKSTSERSLIGGVNLVIRDNEDHLVDLVVVGQELLSCFDSNLGRFNNWIAVCAATDRWKRNGLHRVFEHEAE